jgi:hypothetical protein
MGGRCSVASLAAFLLLVSAGCSGSSSGGSAGKDKAGGTGENKDKIVGAWELVRSESDLKPGEVTWQFSAGSETKAAIKGITTEELILQVDAVAENGSFGALYKRKGGAAKGAEIAGTWLTPSLDKGVDRFLEFTEDGKFKFGISGPQGKTEVLLSGTYEADLDGGKLKLTDQGGGKVVWVKPWTDGSGEVKKGTWRYYHRVNGDQIVAFTIDINGPVNRWTIKSLTDTALVVVDREDKRDEFKKK